MIATPPTRKHSESRSRTTRARYACKPSRTASFSKGLRSFVLKIMCTRLKLNVWGMPEIISRAFSARDAPGPYTWVPASDELRPSSASTPGWYESRPWRSA